MEAARGREASPPDADEALAARAASGDTRAFDLLVGRWRHRIVDFARLMTGDAEQAEDVGQEVFLRLLRNPAAYDPDRPFSAWIRAVTRNLCFDSHRRHAARTKHQRRAVETASFGPSRPTDPADAAVTAEAQAALREAVAALPPRFREAYVLCAVRGLSYEEAAGVSGCGAKTVSTRLARARKRVLERMRKWL